MRPRCCARAFRPPLWGAARSARLGCPPRASAASTWRRVGRQGIGDALADALRDRDDNEEVERAIGARGALVPRLALAPRAGALGARAAAAAKGDGHQGGLLANGVALVTGGLGGLGLTVAHAMLELGAAAVALSSRSARLPYVGQGLEARLGALAAAADARGAELLFPRGAAESEADVIAGLAMLAASTGRPLAAVAHAAGVLRDERLATLTPPMLRDVLAPKAGGAHRIDAALAAHGLAVRACVHFSSLSAVLGNVGQVNYTAANAALDGIALRARAGARRSRSGPRSSVSARRARGEGGGGRRAGPRLRSAEQAAGAFALVAAAAPCVPGAGRGGAAQALLCGGGLFRRNDLPAHRAAAVQRA